MLPGGILCIYMLKCYSKITFQNLVLSQGMAGQALPIGPLIWWSGTDNRFPIFPTIDRDQN